MGDNYKGKNFDFGDGDSKEMRECEMLVRKGYVQKLFDGYYYDERKANNGSATIDLVANEESQKYPNGWSEVKTKHQVRNSRNIIIKTNKVNKMQSPGNRVGVKQALNFYGSGRSALSGSTGVGSFKSASSSK